MHRDVFNKVVRYITKLSTGRRMKSKGMRLFLLKPRTIWEAPTFFLTNKGAVMAKGQDDYVDHLLVKAIGEEDFGEEDFGKIKENFSETELRLWEQLNKEVNNMWRNFWIHALHERGYSNAAIAKEFEIPESTVRNNLKFQIVKRTRVYPRFGSW